MKRFLFPAQALMGRLRYLHKFTLIFVLFLIPLLVLSSILLNALDREVHFLQQEQRGVRYVKALRPLLEHLPRHCGMTNAYLNGDASFQQKIIAERSRIETDLQELEALDAELGGDLRTENKVSALRENWERLQRRAFGLKSKEAFAEHTALIGEVIDLIAYVADSSNLILDPELDSHYLMGAVINRLPVLTDAMGQARGLGVGVAARGGWLKSEEEIQLAVLMERIRDGDGGLSRGLGMAAKMNASVARQLQGSDSQAVEVMGASREQAQQVVDQANLAGNSLETIANAVVHINQMSAQIADAAEAQNQMVEEINRNISGITEMANQNAGGAKQTAQSSEKMARLSTTLQGHVSQFRI